MPLRLSALCLAVLLFVPAFADPAPIGALLEKLNSDDAAERDAAEAELRSGRLH